MIIREITYVVHIISHYFNMFFKINVENIYTLGPLGPLLQRGVFVVLQSAQTLTEVLVLLFKELFLLMISFSELLEGFGCFWSSSFCIGLSGISEPVRSEVIIFLIILIFEGIHFAEVVSLCSSKLLISLFKIVTLSPLFTLSSFSVRGSQDPPCETNLST